MDKNIVTCNSCNKDFCINVELRRLDSDVEQTYFGCPHCQQEFTVIYTNSDIRKIQFNLKRELDRLSKTKSLAARERVDERIRQFKDDLKQSVDELRKRIETST